MSCSCNHNSQITSLEKSQKTYLQYETSDELLNWCSGCGNYGIEKSVIRALTLEGHGYKNVLWCYDVGCSGNASDKVGAYTIHGLHGRILPLAAGASLANRKMKVVAEAGDGATFSEGVNHLVHAVRNDYPVTFLLHNNENYGLTTGQASAMTRMGQKMNGTPDGVFVEPINAVRFVLSLGPTFVARAFSGDQNRMTQIIQEGLRHPGFAFIEIMQLCPTYNKYTSAQWFWDRLKYTDEIKGYDVSNIDTARKAAEDLENNIVLGVLYKRDMPNFYDRVESRKGIKTELVNEVRKTDISGLMKEFM